MTEGADLQINVSKAKVICLGGSRKNLSSQSRHKINRKKPNWVRNVPNQDKKNRSANLPCLIFSASPLKARKDTESHYSGLTLSHKCHQRTQVAKCLLSVKIPIPESLSNLIGNNSVRFLSLWLLKGLDLFEIRKKLLWKVYVNYAHSAWFVCWPF